MFQYENKHLRLEHSALSRTTIEKRIKDKILLADNEGLLIIGLDEIIRCEASSNYTYFYLNNKSKIVISKSLNVYESIFSDSFFSRIHSKHLVNLKYVKRYERGRGGYLILHDNSTLPVSVGKKEKFMENLKSYAFCV